MVVRRQSTRLMWLLVCVYIHCLAIAVSAQQLELHGTLEGHLGSVVSVAFSKDNDAVISGGMDNSVISWAGMHVRPLERCTHPIRCMAFSPDCRTAISGTTNGNIFLFKVATGERIATLSEQGPQVYCVAFSADGKIAASGGQDTTITLWDVGSARKVMTLKGHTCSVNCLAFSPTGPVLASGSGEEIKLWNTKTAQAISTLNSGKDDTTILSDIMKGDVKSQSQRSRELRISRGV